MPCGEGVLVLRVDARRSCEVRIHISLYMSFTEAVFQPMVGFTHVFVQSLTPLIARRGRGVPAPRGIRR